MNCIFPKFLKKARPALVAITVAFVGIAAFTGAPSTAQATVFQFLLHDHPDGGLVDPKYGLRLDGLYGGDSNNFTFSFDAPGTGNSGTVTLATGVWGGGGTIGNDYVLADQSNGSYSFKLNNFDDHRLGGHPGYGGPETFVDWGWVNYWAAGATPRTHVYSSDWLFTAQLLNPTPNSEAPASGSALVLGLGVAGLAWRRRPKRRGA